MPQSLTGADRSAAADAELFKINMNP